MSDFWRRYLCRIGFHRWKYVASLHRTNPFTGRPFGYDKERCRSCGKEGFTPTMIP